MVQKITKQETLYVEQTVDVEKFISSDGQEFDTEEQAILYENYRKIPQRFFPMEASYFQTSGTWYFFSNENEMKSITNACNYDELPEDLQYPAWILLQTERSYSYHDEDRYYVYTKDKAAEMLKNALEFVESLL